jgi:two-component system, repressor protein LuxO
MAISIRRVLLVEDSVPMARVYVEYLRREPYDVHHVETGREALAAIAACPPQVLVLDVRLPDMDGLDILRHVRKKDLPCSVVVITAHGSVNMAVEAMRQGAFDFILKPFDADRLIFTLRNAIERQHLTQVVETIKRDFDRREYCGFIGSSLPMQAVYRIIDSAAPSKATVFITGESGTGKEVCAEALHHLSGRGERPLIAVNCAAIPRDLMESEIFGHVKGAFTGAMTDRDGAASLAHGGTLFLDEICDMDMSLQAKLLRFVQTGSFQKVGSDETRTVDVRFVCATNRDPWKEVGEGRFREDLYYRLHVIPIHLPPLRERDDDVLAMARHFLVRFAQEEGRDFRGFSPEAEQAIAAHPWPGNVREMQNILRSVVVLNTGEEVSLDMLPAGVFRLGAGPRASGMATASAMPPETLAHADVQLRPLWQVEKEMIDEALRVCDGNVPRAAAILEMSPSTLYRRIRKDEDGG